MDNHSVHWSHDVRDEMMEYSIVPVFLPAHSSPLNSIERLWNLIKK